MFIGRFKLGQFAPLYCQCRNAAQQPAAPVETPVAMIYDAAGVKVKTVRLPVIDRFAAPGLFIFPMALGTGFVVGTYSVAIQFTVGAEVHLLASHFEVVDGGNVNGAIISMAFYNRPHAKFLVQKLDSFQRNIVKNPRSS